MEPDPALSEDLPPHGIKVGNAKAEQPARSQCVGAPSDHVAGVLEVLEHMPHGDHIKSPMNIVHRSVNIQSDTTCVQGRLLGQLNTDDVESSAPRLIQEEAVVASDIKPSSWRWIES